MGEEEMQLYEYETQFFGFTPQSFVDGVISAVNDYVFDVISELKETLLRKGYPPARLTKELNAVIRHIQDKVDQNFDLFELYCLQNIFKIPSNVYISTSEVRLG